MRSPLGRRDASTAGLCGEAGDRFSPARLLRVRACGAASRLRGPNRSPAQAVRLPLPVPEVVLVGERGLLDGGLLTVEPGLRLLGRDLAADHRQLLLEVLGLAFPVVG